MGNIEQPSQQFLQRYRFIEIVQDNNFGRIKVYRKKQLNFDYMMVLDRYIQSQSIDQMTKQLQSIQQIFHRSYQQPHLLKIFHFEIFSKTHLHCNLSLLRLYIEYYNYSLHQLIIKKYEIGQSLNLNQIYLIINAAIETYQLLLNINSNLFVCNLNSILVSPQGYIKFLPIQVKEFKQQQNTFCKTLCFPVQRCTTNFDKHHKRFITQLLKLIHELIQINNYYDNYLYHHLVQLQKQIKPIKNLNQIKKIIPPSQIKSLVINKKQLQSDYNPTDTPPSSQTNHFTYKKSMKKSMPK